MNTSELTARDNMLGSAYMLLAMAGFAIGDSILKFVGGDIPLGQVLLIRGSFAAIILFVMALALGQLRPVSSILQGAFIFRLLGEVVAAYFFLTALFNMPIANASAILQALPLTVTLGAAFFLGETIGWRRIAAIMVGLFGVILIIQPGLEGFNVFSLYCLIAVVGTTIRDLATRKLNKDTPTLFVSLVSVIAVAIGGGVLSIFETWVPLGIYEISMLGAASVFLVAAFIAIVSAMRVGEIGVVTPFRYSVLLFAIIIGIFVFKEIPNTLTILGSIIVVSSGIYTIYRERKVAS